MTAYYNENNPYCAQWLKNLIAAGHIAPGDIDERDIRDVRPDDLAGYAQCHFFAGIGVWSHALRRAGWPDDRPLWTGSCPCQPFSAAGAGLGFTDERHLWPYWFHLIGQCRPAVILGEQVKAAIKHGWLDLVQSDLEGIGYAFAAAGIPAAGVGAPHIRQRLWFVADTAGDRQLWPWSRGTAEEGWPPRPECIGQLPDGFEGHGITGELAESAGERYDRWRPGKARNGIDTPRLEPKRFCDARGLADDDSMRPQGWLSGGSDTQWEIEHGQAGYSGATGRMADAIDGQFQEKGRQPVGRIGQSGAGTECSPACPNDSQWRDADWLLCRDEKWRPVEPGTFPLAHGAAARVGRLRAYGNAIVTQVASEVIAAYNAVYK